MTRQTTELENIRREEIRQDLKSGLRPRQIAVKQDLSKSALYRHLQKIRKENADRLTALRGEDDDLLMSYRLCIESLEDRWREMYKLEDESNDARFKIKVSRMLCDLEMTLLNLKLYGPTVLSLTSKKSLPRRFLPP